MRRLLHAIEQTQRQGHRRVDGVGTGAAVDPRMYSRTQVTGGISSLDELHVLVEHGHVVEARPPQLDAHQMIGGIDARQQRERR